MNQGTLPGATPCVTSNLQRFLARLDRPALEAVAQAAIDQLDTIDGDADQEDGDHDMCGASDDCGTGMTWLGRGDDLPGDTADAEPNGDERDGTYGEDDFVSFGGFGPGCQLADSGVSDHETLERCGEYGIDQSRLISRTAAFINVNGLTQEEVNLAAAPVAVMRTRIAGQLGIRIGEGPAA
jgi:hypothetical protein